MEAETYLRRLFCDLIVVLRLRPLAEGCFLSETELIAELRITPTGISGSSSMSKTDLIAVLRLRLPTGGCSLPKTDLIAVWRLSLLFGGYSLT
jgi:hypothetical protein